MHREKNSKKSKQRNKYGKNNRFKKLKLKIKKRKEKGRGKKK